MLCRTKWVSNLAHSQGDKVAQHHMKMKMVANGWSKYRLFRLLLLVVSSCLMCFFKSAHC